MKAISVVYSTRKKEEAYIRRIQETAGIPTQILCYENSGDQSLTAVYNRGLAESQHEVVVFLHDDLLFEKDNWGGKVYEALTTTDFGIVGKAGTTHLPVSAKWWEEAGQMVGRVYHQQLHPQTQKPMKWLSEYSGLFIHHITPVVMVDGLFIGVHKNKLKHSFDEAITSFHFYDVDFCVSNFLAGVPVGVMYNFNLTHKSVGATNEKWETNREQVAKKYETVLPLKVSPILIVEDKVVRLKKEPMVSVIILTKGKVELMTRLLQSLHRTRYQHLEVIIADTGSTAEEKAALRDLTVTACPGREVRLVEYDYYNFAKINNDVVRQHLHPQSELLVFCNNDVMFVNDCISLMVDTYLKNKGNCGTVGARLHFADQTIQHAGIFLSRDKEKRLVAGHVGYKTGYQYQNRVYPVLGNTAALLLVSKVLFEKAGAFNESYERCFEDVELNIQMLLRNYQNFICGEAVAYHLESQTRSPQIAEADYQQMVAVVEKNLHKLAKYILKP